MWMFFKWFSIMIVTFNKLEIWLELLDSEFLLLSIEKWGRSLEFVRFFFGYLACTLSKRCIIEGDFEVWCITTFQQVILLQKDWDHSHIGYLQKLTFFFLVQLIYPGTAMTMPCQLNTPYATSALILMALITSWPKSIWYSCSVLGNICKIWGK